MITKDNFKEFLLSIGFERVSVGDFFTKKYSSCSIHVDFDNNKLIYPEAEGLVVNDKTTSNFSHNIMETHTHSFCEYVNSIRRNI